MNLWCSQLAPNLLFACCGLYNSGASPECASFHLNLLYPRKLFVGLQWGDNVFMLHDLISRCYSLVSASYLSEGSHYFAGHVISTAY